MATETMSATVTLDKPVVSVEHLEAAPAGPALLFSQGTDVTYGDFRDDIIRDGYAVVKGAIPKERAIQYGEQMYKFLEDL